MKRLKWAGWAAVAAALGFAGRERLAADRLAERGGGPSSEAAALFDVVKDTKTATVWIDGALGTVPPPAPAPKAAPAAPAAPHEPFHWVDGKSSPSEIRTAPNKRGRVRAEHGAGVLVDSHGRRWEILPPPSTSTARGSVSAPSAAPSAPAAAPADPAEIAARRENSLNALKCAGVAAAALLLW
jgi:hypothetical protein